MPLRLLLLLHLLCLSLAMNIRNAVLFELHCWLKPSYSVLVRRMKGQSGSAAKGENSSTGNRVLSSLRNLVRLPKGTKSTAKAVTTTDPSPPAKAVTAPDPSPPAKAVSTVKVATPDEIRRKFDNVEDPEERRLTEIAYWS